MKRTFVQMPDGELVPKEEVRERERPVDSGALWGDRNYAGLRSSDGTPIDTRTKHREYMRANGLTTIDDYPKHFERAAQERAKVFRGEDTSRREDVARALAKLHG